jgi:hypothetical protein
MGNRNPYRLAEYPTRKSGTGCFIATAAYGTPFANEINILRNWRDRWLLQRITGRLFVKFYYTFSPPVASNIANSEVRKEQTRRILRPIVKILSGRYEK